MRRIDEPGEAAVLAAVAAPWRLRSGEVALWRVPLDAQPESVVAELREVMSADETARAEKFYFERDRRRFVVGRGILRRLLGRYLGCGPADIVFRYGPNGKPAVALPADASFHFNLAHSEGLALYAFTRGGDVGVDLERVRDMPDWEFIAATCFTTDEQAALRRAGPDERQREFFAAWTRQEARLKATGVGLGGEVRWRRTDERPVEADDKRRPDRHTDGHNPAFPGVASASPRLYPITVAPGYAATLAIGANARWATCFDWSSFVELARGARASRRPRRLKLDHPRLTLLEFL
jgi:4'-phosphopantetheinyl transferase